METHIGIGVYPVSAGGVAAIDYRDRRVRMREQRVGKRGTVRNSVCRAG